VDISRTNAVVHTRISIFSERELLFGDLCELNTSVQILFSNGNKDYILHNQARIGILKKYCESSFSLLLHKSKQLCNEQALGKCWQGQNDNTHCIHKQSYT